MAKGINKVILVGNLGKDPEVRQLPSGGTVANLVVATSDSWKEKQTGEAKEKTEWHRVTMFNQLGEIAGKYLKKGSKVYLEGKLQTRKYQGPDGLDRYATEVIANEMQMLDSRGDAAPQQSGRQQPNSHHQQAPQQQNSYQQAQQQAAPPQNSGFADFDDDIPF